MIAPKGSRRRTFAGLVLAIFVAPVATALCFELAIVPTLHPAENFLDVIGGGATFLLFALLFGGLLAALPVLFFGSLTIAVAHLLGTKSPVFYAAAGLLAGLFMGWVDSGRTKSAFSMLEAVPFVIGGGLSALSYWLVAER